MTPEDFYLDTKKLDEGVRLPLRGPTGKITEHWLQVRSLWSDGYQQEMTAALRGQYEANPGGDLPKTEREIVKTFRHLLVTAWSFEQEFSREAVKALLDNNPSVASSVVEVAGRDTLFFPDTGGNSSPGQSGK